jgi:hypothetical protein
MKLSQVALTSAMMATALSAVTVVADNAQFRETITVKGVASMAKGAPGDHYLTFSVPIALPNVSLAAGTYVFRRPASNVLQVLTADGREPCALLMTRPVSRNSSLDTYQIVLRPADMPGAPRRIESWFAPGEMTGQQLSYGR